MEEELLYVIIIILLILGRTCIFSDCYVLNSVTGKKHN